MATTPRHGSLGGSRPVAADPLQSLARALPTVTACACAMRLRCAPLAYELLCRVAQTPLTRADILTRTQVRGVILLLLACRQGTCGSAGGQSSQACGCNGGNSAAWLGVAPHLRVTAQWATAKLGLGRRLDHGPTAGRSDCVFAWHVRMGVPSIVSPHTLQGPRAPWACPPHTRRPGVGGVSGCY